MMGYGRPGVGWFFSLSGVARFLLLLLIIGLIVAIAADNEGYWDAIRILGVLSFLVALPAFYMPPRPVGLTDHLLFLTATLAGFTVSLTAAKPTVGLELLLLILAILVHHYLSRPPLPQPTPMRGRGYWR
jgi:hypothetical protein